MGLKELSYLMGLIWGVYSIFLMVYAVRNKERKNGKHIILIAVVCAVLLLTDIFVLPEILLYPIGLEILLFWLLSAIAGIFYLISIIISCVKMKKKQENSEASNLKTFWKVTACITIIPILLFSAIVVRDLFLINHSDLLIVLE